MLVVRLMYFLRSTMVLLCQVLGGCALSDVCRPRPRCVIFDMQPSPRSTRGELAPPGAGQEAARVRGVFPHLARAQLPPGGAGEQPQAEPGAQGAEQVHPVQGADCDRRQNGPPPPVPVVWELLLVRARPRLFQMLLISPVYID